MGYDLMSYTKNNQSSNGYDLMKYVKKDEPSSQPDFMTGMFNSPDTTPSKIDFFPAHTLSVISQPNPRPISQPSAWDKIKVGDIKGLASDVGIGLAHGLANTGTVKLGNSFDQMLSQSKDPGTALYGKQQLANQQLQQNYLNANPVNSLPAMLGEQIPQIPLWMAGEGAVKALGSGLGKLAPSLASTAEKVGSKIPSFVKGGLLDATTYGTVVAPVETVAQGDGLQGLLEREKQLPTVALGGIVTRGALKGIGEGTNLVKDAIKPLGVPAEPFGPPRPTYNVQRRTGLGPLSSNDSIPLSDGLNLSSTIRKADITSNPLQDVQNSFKTAPTLQDINANELQKNSIKFNAGTDQTPTPITPTPQLELNAKQGDLQKLFNQLPNQGKYSFTTGEQRALGALQDGIQTAQNYIGHTDVLAGYPVGTTIPQAYADIAKNTGVDLPKLMTNWEKTQTLKTSLSPQELKMGRAAGVIPDLAPRKSLADMNLDMNSQKVVEPPSSPSIQSILSEQKTLKNWTNKDNIPITNSAPIRPIPEQQTLADVLKSRENQPITPNEAVNPAIGQPKDSQPIVPNEQVTAPIGEPKVQAPLPRDERAFWQNVSKELHSTGQRPPITTELMKQDIISGKIDISKLSNEEDIRRMLGMDLQKFGEKAEPQIVGREPDIPLGLKERGVSENIRTDANRPDELRDSYSVDPLVYKQLGNKETLTKAQDIFNKGLEPAITELDTLIKDLKPEAAPLVKMIADKLTNEGNIVRARELMSNAALRATESGQFGQAFRILRDADPETFLMTFDKQLNKLNKEGLAQYGKKWKNVDLTPDELTMVSNIERGNQASYDSAFEQIQARIANEMPASAFEKINAWRHISMLMNPKTHIRNVGGNAIMMGMRKAAQRTSGALQKVFLPEADRTQAVFVNKEYKDLAKEYFDANSKELLGGANKYQEGISLNMPNKRVFSNNTLEKVRKFNYELLQKGDNPFFQNAYIDRLASYAQAKGMKDFSKLGQEAFDTARLEAEQATYKDSSSIADFINKHKRIDKNSSFGTKVKAGLVEAALPFTKTPINIIKRGMQYSPIGVANGLAGIKSSKGAAMAIDELAKGLTGTGILGLGYLLASKGILTGKASSDADLKAYDTNTGNSPFSILGKYSYDWAQPFSVPLSVGVEIYNAIKSNPADTAKMNGVIANNDTSRLQQMALTAANGIMEGLNASGDTVFNMSIMKGIKTLLGSGTKGFMEGLAQLPQNYATQFIPTLSSQLSGTIDPLVRSTYVSGNLPASLKNTLISKIPFASKTLQPKQTPYGEDMKKIENPIGRAFSQFISPGIIAKDQGSVSPKIDTELRRLNEFGLTNQFPTMVPNYVEKTQTHPRITLNPDEATRYQQRTGQLTLNSFQRVMNSGPYINARKTNLKSPDEVRADLLAKAISESKATAKKEILKSKGYK